MFETGDIVTFESAKDHAHVAVDATLAYRRSQLERFVRHLVFMKPHLLVVYHVLITPSGRSPIWLMQTVTQPDVGQSEFGVVNGAGELRAVTLLPTQATIQTTETLAGYRVEVTGNGSQETPRQDTHRFLHILAIGDAGSVTVPEAGWTKQGNRLAVWIRRGGGRRTAYLPWDG